MALIVRWSRSTRTGYSSLRGDRMATTINSPSSFRYAPPIERRRRHRLRAARAARTAPSCIERAPGRRDGSPALRLHSHFSGGAPSALFLAGGYRGMKRSTRSSGEAPPALFLAGHGGMKRPTRAAKCAGRLHYAQRHVGTAVARRFDLAWHAQASGHRRPAARPCRQNAREVRLVSPWSVKLRNHDETRAEPAGRRVSESGFRPPPIPKAADR